MTPPVELFLSYASDDRELADRIAGLLREYGIDVWSSQSRIAGVQPWHDEIGEALDRCDWFAVMLSRSAVESVWVKREVVYALNRTDLNNRIVPILVEDCNARALTWALSGSQYVDFRHSFDKGSRTLLSVWGLSQSPRA